MSLGFVIQARVGSTRLPNKVVLPFYENKGILELLIERLKSKYHNAPIVVATSKSAKDDIIEKVAKTFGVCCFRGNENDVLSRFIEAAEAYNLEQIIRICSDNPFLDIDSCELLCKSFKEERSDYIGFSIKGTPSIKTHFGFWAELTTLSSLKKVASLTNESLYREHVTNFIYANPELFAIKLLKVARLVEERSDIRLTVDTEQDFANLQNLYEHLVQNNVPLTPDSIIKEIEHFPMLKESMLTQIFNNSK